MGAPIGSTAHAWRKSGEMVKDADGYDVEEWVIELADVPCRIAPAKGTRILSNPGGDVQASLPEIHFPADTAGIKDDDVIEIVAGRHEGTLWRVVESDGFDQTTALRLPVESAERPAGLGL